jgi:N-ethylmaleimide reductase
MKLLEKNTLKNRMVMSAMTRSRANTEGVVNDMTVEYYSQRASVGMIITEAINISKDAIGSPFTPGLYTQEQIDAWKKVTKAIHDKGGIIHAQLWHAGRVGHSVDRDGNLPVSSSAVAIKEMHHFTSLGIKDFETPRALSIQEIKQIINDYRQAALNAMEAGFDGVQLHAANGYLPHQFLSDNANIRDDEYGGSIENKSRFILEIMHVLIDAVGGERVSIKISPLHPYADIVHVNPISTYTYLIEELNKLDFAYLELMKRNPNFPLLPHYPKDDEIELFGSKTKASLIANGAYKRDSGEAELNKGIAKLISYGTLFIANPDLPERFELDAELNEADPKTMFGGGANGYTDYPVFLRPLNIEL